MRQDRRCTDLRNGGGRGKQPNPFASRIHLRFAKVDATFAKRRWMRQDRRCTDRRNGGGLI